MGHRIIQMEKQKLFFSKKENVYYYVTYGELPSCEICHKEIDRILVYHTSWRKRSEEIRTYHIKCYHKIIPRGSIDEFKTCVVVDEMPEDIHPVFERRPVLANSGGSSTFEVFKLVKGSEAEIKDRTKFARDHGQWSFPCYKKNLKMFEQKEEELGFSGFILKDIQRDKIMQIEHENKRKENLIACKVLQVKDDCIKVKTNEGAELDINKEELPLQPRKYRKDQEIIARIKIKENDLILSLSLKEVEDTERERAYLKEIKPKEVDIKDFLENLKSSEILLPHQDFLELISSEELNNKKFSLEDKSK